MRNQAGSIAPAEWRALFPPHWKDQRYYQTLDETLAGQFDQRYLLLRQEGRLRAIQPFFLVEQDLTVSLAPWLRACLQPWRKLLTVRLLMVGCIVGDAQIGIPLPGNAAEICAPLDAALRRCAHQEGVSLWLFKDVPEQYRAPLTGLVRHSGYVRLPSLPGVRLPLDFASFEEYLQTRLGKSTRKNLRRRFREAAAQPEPLILEVRETVGSAEAADLHALYEQVALRADDRFEVFDRDYFLRLAARMPDQTRFFSWRHGGRVVAFSFCTVHGGTLYDNDIGLDETAAPALNLYHVTFRDIIQWALAHGIKEYRSCPFNYDPKLHLRMSLVPLDLYACHARPWVNWLLRRFAPLAAPMRQIPLLRKFPNFARL